MILLSLLFFYDIFFVFGTDVMLTVAKSIKGPIKILFMGEWKEDGTRKSNLLGLGDIVLPGVFVSLCMRFDLIKSLKINGDLKEILTDSSKARQIYDQMVKGCLSAPKTYYHNCIIGYIIAITATIAVMFIFDHGQPALLYLVPGCILAVLLTAAAKGEVNLMWEHVEDQYVGGGAGEEEKKEGEDKDKKE